MNMENQMAGTYRMSPQTQYSSPISSASSTDSSVFSVDATSQTSETTAGSAKSVSPVCWNNEDSWRPASPIQVPVRQVRPQLAPLQINTQDAVPSELRQNPRRCITSICQRPIPNLERQSARKGHFVDSLVDSARLMVEEIWPLSAPNCRLQGPGTQEVLNLRFFIQETLRRSKTSFSTLQVALYYLILIKAHLPRSDFTMEQAIDSRSFRALQCGRRMFLAALILASKYLQDRNYSARAWSKISGLKVCEINANEMAFLKAVNWKLHVPEALFEKWQSILLKYTSPTSPSACSTTSAGAYEWQMLVRQLSPELDNVPWAFGSSHAISPVMASPIRISTLPTPIQPSLNSPVSLYPPRTLEPMPNMLPPTPMLARASHLPTPTLTPQTAVNNTPAVGLTGFESGRSAMCSAMAAVRSQSMNSCMDSWAQNQQTGFSAASRRPSIISSASSTSSPESMVSDHSRLSRASSIASVSSLSSVNACAPTPVRLARMATLRNAGMTYQLPPLTPLKERQAKDNVPFGYVTMEPIVAEPMSSPDMDGFSIHDRDSPARGRFQREASSDSVTSKRKRGQSSVDLTLQQNVRSLLNASNVIDITESPRIRVVTDNHVASSFLLDTGSTTLLSPARSVPDYRMPIQRDAGRKRTCKENVPVRSVSAITYYDLTGQ